jgi:hypothetical protein
MAAVSSCQVGNFGRTLRNRCLVRSWGSKALISMFLLSNTAFSATLLWDPNSETNLAGYKVYSGTSSRDYSSVVNVGKTTQYPLTNVVQGATYFFALTAYTTGGLESDLSTEVSYIPPTANTRPTISSFSPRSINEDASTGPITFTVWDAETPGSLTLSATSSNPVLVPSGNMVLGGSGTNRTLTVMPAANQSGTATITVSVSDGQLSASNSFVLTVNAVNDAPTIANIADRTIDQNTATGPVGFTIGDVETAASSLVLTGNSSNPTLVPNQNIVFGGSGSSRTVNVTPVANQSGTATINVTVSDGAWTASDSWVLTVRTNATTNTPPVLSTVRNTTIFSSGTSLPLRFSVSDAQTPSDALVLRASSSNPALIAGSNVVFEGSGSNRTLTVSAANGIGNASITLAVDDGDGGRASNTFGVTVAARPAQLAYLPLEAEQGTIVAPMRPYTNSSVIYVATTTAEQGTLSFDFSVGEAGSYLVWARHLSPNNGQDSFYVSMDGVEVLYSTATGTWSSNWQWTRVNAAVNGATQDPLIFNLSTGVHRLVFRGRESNCGLDRIIVCNDLEFVPTDAGLTSLASTTTDDVNATVEMASHEQVEVSWESTPGLTYKVQGKRDLLDTWEDVSDPIVAQDSKSSWIVPEPAFQFYRVVLVE